VSKYVKIPKDFNKITSTLCQMSHENPRKIEHGTNRVLKSVCLLALHQQWPRLLLQSHYSLRHAPCVLRSKPWHTINTAECSLISVTYLQYNYIVPSFSWKLQMSCRKKLCNASLPPSDLVYRPCQHALACKCVKLLPKRKKVSK